MADDCADLPIGVIGSYVEVDAYEELLAALRDLHGQIAQAEECGDVLVRSPSLRAAMDRARPFIDRLADR